VDTLKPLSAETSCGKYSAALECVSPQIAFSGLIPFSNQRGNMNARTIVIALLTCFVGLTLCFADDANMGTWKLNDLSRS
jgi:hypothetical protein